MVLSAPPLPGLRRPQHRRADERGNLQGWAVFLSATLNSYGQPKSPTSVVPAKAGTHPRQGAPPVNGAVGPTPTRTSTTAAPSCRRKRESTGVGRVPLSNSEQLRPTQIPHLRRSREGGNPSPTGCTTMTPEAVRHAPRPNQVGSLGQRAGLRETARLCYSARMEQTQAHHASPAGGAPPTTARETTPVPFMLRCSDSDRGSGISGVSFPGKVSHPPDRNETEWDRMRQFRAEETAGGLAGRRVDALSWPFASSSLNSWRALGSI